MEGLSAKQDKTCYQLLKLKGLVSADFLSILIIFGIHVIWVTSRFMPDLKIKSTLGMTPVPLPA